MLSLTAHGQTYQMEDTGGKISKCMKAGVPYESSLLEHIYSQGFEGLAVDAGANIGNHTLWFAVMCGLDVAAFEPLHHQVLQDHVTRNDVNHQVTVYPVALGDEDGHAAHVGKGRLDTGKDPTPSSEPDVASGRWIKSGNQVEVRRLDSYGLTGVSVIKIDVEGMEANVLRGGEETIRRDRPAIFAEYWDQTYRRRIDDVIGPWGYRLTRSFGKSTQVGRWDP